MRRLALVVGIHNFLDDDELENLNLAAAVHDIGKVKWPKNLFHKKITILN